MFKIGLITKSYTFTAGATIIASEHNTNFDTLYNEVNGELTNANVKATAAIAYSKLNLSASIVNADVSATAAIAGQKISPTFANNVTLGTAGNKFLIKMGTNASMGTALLQGGTAVVANTLITTASMVFLSNKVVGGTAGALWLGSVAAGTSFFVNSTVATDSSTISYLIVEPA